MRFRKEYDFLSNLYEAPVTVEILGRNYTFRNAEAAFQVHKSDDPEEISKFQTMSGVPAKRYGKRVHIPGGIEAWNERRIDVMKYVVTEKFKQNPDLMQKLRNVEGDIVEDNTWNDTFWGVCRGNGLNHLGKILMMVRDDAKQC